MPLKTTFAANANNIHSGPGFLFVNILRPLFGLRPLNDGNNPPSVVDPSTPAAWAATTAYTVGETVLDSNNNVQVCTAAGTSGSTAPTWNTGAGGTTTDATVTWTVAGPSWIWKLTTPVIVDQQIRDTNSNIQQCTVAGTTGATQPTWSQVYGGITTDGSAEWQNYGPTLASGAAEGSVDYDAQAKFLAVEADQFTAPLDQRLTGESAKVTATLRELQMTLVSRAIPQAAFASGSDPGLPAGAQNYEEVTFGGLVLIPKPCLLILSPRPNYAAPSRYVGATLYKAAATPPGGGFPFSLKKITDYKAAWEGNAITWRPAGDQIGQIYRQL